jgi:hypothetical protein
MRYTSSATEANALDDVIKRNFLLALKYHTGGI